MPTVISSFASNERLLKLLEPAADGQQGDDAEQSGQQERGEPAEGQEIHDMEMWHPRVPSRDTV